MAAAGLAIGLLTGQAMWSDTPPAPSTIAQANSTHWTQPAPQHSGDSLARGTLRT
jgi:hypothetical protein